MKNLENYGVQSLNAQEIRGVDGGGKGFWSGVKDGLKYDLSYAEGFVNGFLDF